MGLRMQGFMRRFAVISMLGLFVSGCASMSTSLQSAWFDSTFNGPPFKRILVVGVTGTMTDRRVFDDIFAQSLNSVGVQGIPGYQFIDNAPSASAEVFNDGVTKSGADGLLVVRLLGVDNRTNVSTIMVPSMWAGPIGGPFGNPMGSPFGPFAPSWAMVPDVQQYQIANVEATLFDVKTRRPIWSATTQTFNPTSVAAESPGYAKLIIAQLGARGLVQIKPTP